MKAIWKEKMGLGEEKIEAFEGIGRIIHFSVVGVMRVSRILRIFAPGNHN